MTSMRPPTTRARAAAKGVAAAIWQYSQQLLIKSSRNNIYKRSVLQSSVWSSIGHHAPKRHYASLSGPVPLDLDQAKAALANPQEWRDLKEVWLFGDHQAEWNPQKEVHDPKCHAKLSHVLGALDSSDRVERVRMGLGTVMSLPLRHKNSNENQPRTPKTILRPVTVEAICTELCHWVLPDYPKIEILGASHSTLKEAQRRRERFSGSMSPSYKAFDKTATFYGKELQQDPVKAALNPVVDLGPYGQGWHKKFSTDHFSVLFELLYLQNYFGKRPNWANGLADTPGDDESRV